MREVEIEVERRHGHLRTEDFLALQGDVRVDHVVREDPAFEEEVAVGVERVERNFERRGDGRDLRVFFGRQIVEVLVGRFARMDLVFDPVAAKPRYGLQSGSGKRTSTRRAFGLVTCGMRIEAERLRAEYANFTGASKPGTRRLKELVLGFVMAQREWMCLRRPPMIQWASRLR